jgi:hypothetical protein
MRVLLLIHRYLGIAVGTLMAMWCVSGVIILSRLSPAGGDVARLNFGGPH